MRTGGDVTESTPGGRLDLEKGPARSQPVDPATPRGVGSGAMAPVHVREEAIRRDPATSALLSPVCRSRAGTRDRRWRRPRHGVSEIAAIPGEQRQRFNPAVRDIDVRVEEEPQQVGVSCAELRLVIND